MAKTSSALRRLEALPLWDGRNYLKLEACERILLALGNPQNAIPTIHVAGTNGKGSVCSYLAACLWASGARVGQFASPHLSHVTERCLVNGQPVGEDDFARCVAQVLEVCEQLGEQPTYFVAGMAATFLHFVERQLDYAVIEVGLGGRYDATNAITRPLASVITNIGFDHTNILGSTLREIAENKAGIIKKGVPVFVAPNSSEVLEVCREEAQRVGAAIYCAGEYYRIDSPSRTLRWQRDVVDDQSRGRAWQFTQGELRGNVAYQLENAALAVLVGDYLGLCERAIRRGLSAARWPARTEWVEVALEERSVADGERIGVLMDGTHNTSGAQVLGSYLADYLGENPEYRHLVVLFGVRQGKAWQEMIEILASVFAGVNVRVTWVFSGGDIEGAEDPQVLARDFAQAYCRRNSIEALDFSLQLVAESLAQAEKSFLLITGSLYFIGALRPRLVKEPFLSIAQ